MSAGHVINIKVAKSTNFKHVESSICDRAMPFAVKPKMNMPNSNSLQAGEAKGNDIWLNQILCSKNLKICKYHCPSPACKLLLFGISIFGFTAKGIARSQTDDSTCYLQSRNLWALRPKFKRLMYIQLKIIERDSSGFANSGPKFCTCDLKFNLKWGPWSKFFWYDQRFRRYSIVGRSGETVGPIKKICFTDPT